MTRVAGGLCASGLLLPRICAHALVAMCVTLAAGCGGYSGPSPTSPPPLVQLPDGSYTLTIASSGSCVQTSSGGSAAVDSVLNAAVESRQNGDGWQVRLSDASAGTLNITLAPSRSEATVFGSTSGSVTAGAVRVTLAHTIFGAARAGGGLTGLIQPTVTYEAVAGGASTICTSNTWTLAPR